MKIKDAMCSAQTVHCNVTIMCENEEACGNSHTYLGLPSDAEEQVKKIGWSVRSYKVRCVPCTEQQNALMLSAIRGI